MDRIAGLRRLHEQDYGIGFPAVRIVDGSFKQPGVTPIALQDYQAGHVPGAVYVSLEDELSDHAVEGRGRHPLPSGRDLEAAARRWGVRDGVPVVVYDDWNRAGSARAWWVLTTAGLRGVEEDRVTIESATDRLNPLFEGGRKILSEFRDAGQ